MSRPPPEQSEQSDLHASSVHIGTPFTAVLGADHLWPDHPGHMIIPGVNMATHSHLGAI